LPTFIEPAEGKKADARYPLVLSSAKNGYFCHSQHRGLVSLRKRATYPTLEIAADLALERGIVEGDPVVVTTRNGQARFKAKLSESMQRDAVVAEFGWWQACPEIGAPGFPLQGPNNSHYNGLISSENSDPISGSVPLRSFRCQIARDPAFDVLRRTWNGWRQFIVSEVSRPAEGVLGIRFTPLDKKGLPDFQPGQHVSIRVLTAHGAEPLVRAYSLTGPAHLDARTDYAIAVRHQRGVDAAGAGWQGALSSHLHSRIAVGNIVELQAPSGRFTLPIESAEPLVLIAGGIGITPFISQLETIFQDGRPVSNIHLHYANRNGSFHAFKERLKELAALLPGLTVTNYYDAPIVGESEHRCERITDRVVTDEQIRKRARVYLCGPDAMMRAIRAGLVARGMPDFDIFHEAFGAAIRAVVDNGQPHEITFTRSGRKATWHPSSGTLLEFAEKMGISMPSGCRVGQCESCAIQIIKGTVEHLHGEAPDDPAIVLGCQAVPRSDLEIYA
jgi:ferredoxin-NADP reductase